MKHTFTKLTLLVLTASNLLLPNFSSSQCINATGGTITYTDSLGLNPTPSSPYTGGYTIHTFSGSDTFKLISGIHDVDYLIVAGGGGGGSFSGEIAWTGGGGGGGILAGTTTVSVSNYPVTIGTGGAPNTKGGNSIFGGLVAEGGGRGGTSIQPGGDGGSGSGGGASASAYTTGGTATQGSNGANGVVNISGGGGGGYSFAGNLATGGDGYLSPISGTSIYYSGGGGGGGSTSNLGGQGGGGHGGCAVACGGIPTAGTANTGGGGGGTARFSGSSANGGAGGSGVVILRYKTCPNTNGVSPLSSTHLKGISINNIFPNPASDKLEYEIGSTEKMTLQVRVINMLGQIVISKTENIDVGISDHTLNVSGLSSGSYLLQITNGNLEKTQKQFVRS